MLRAPIPNPVRTAFGTMHDRPAVLVALRDDEGNTGWGEIWCNFPSCGAEHRARLVETELAPLLLGRRVSDPAEVFVELTAKLHSLVNQTGEEGPVAQAIAGVDVALWELAARRAEVPLWKLLGGKSNSIDTYSSGLNPNEPQKLASIKREGGYSSFKLKVGFDDSLDINNVRVMRETLGNEVRLMVDANQAWDIERAKYMVKALQKFELTWVEEPLPVDALTDEWRVLSKESSIPLAGGENLRGFGAFHDAVESGHFSYLQPDIAKWGGITGCLTVAKEINSAGLIYCPHWLGGAVGLLASAHLLAAVGGDGILEVDANPNPLRDSLFGSMPRMENGRWYLGAGQGIGEQPSEEILERYCVLEIKLIADQ